MSEIYHSRNETFSSKELGAIDEIFQSSDETTSISLYNQS